MPSNSATSSRGSPVPARLYCGMGGHQHLGIPLRHFICHGGMIVDCGADGHFFFKRAHPEERKLQNGNRPVLVRVIPRAELCHLEGTDADAVQVLTVVRQTAIAHIDGKFAVGLLADQFGQFFDMLGEGAALAPSEAFHSVAIASVAKARLIAATAVRPSNFCMVSPPKVSCELMAAVSANQPINPRKKTAGKIRLSLRNSAGKGQMPPYKSAPLSKASLTIFSFSVRRPMPSASATASMRPSCARIALAINSRSKEATASRRVSGTSSCTGSIRMA